MIRILVVDDSLFIRTIVKDALNKDPELEVVDTAANGIEALRKIPLTKPDVVTLDVHMPRMNGLDTLRGMETLDFKPKVLMLSSLTSRDADITNRALKLGADDFVLKPHNVHNVDSVMQEVIEKIKNLVRIKRYTGVRSTPSDTANRIVVIGSSAGGPPMLDNIVSKLKPDLQAAVVITQHMPEGFTAALALRLDKVAPMPVKETGTGDVLMKGEIYVSKAGFHTMISQAVNARKKKYGKIVHSQSPPVHAVRPAIDNTFRTAAKVFGKNTLGVVISGMGNDCGEGARAIKDAGGHVIVCDERDCLVYGMARSVIRHDAADEIVRFKEIPSLINERISAMR